MMKLFAWILIVGYLVSCSKNKLSVPMPLSQEDNIYVQDINLFFKTNHNNWKAHLYTFNQPIELNTKYENNQLNVWYKTSKPNLEGSVKVCLSANDTCFCYNYYLQNKNNLIQFVKDYRSPKTVNPDSSLHHDKIFYVIDEAQNLKVKNNRIFNQEQVLLEPIVKTTNAIENDNLTAYYVQPGSIKNIEIFFIKDTQSNNFIISTSLLKDKHDNIVANGTKICFESVLLNKISKAYAPTINGLASVKLPITVYKGFTLKAYSNNIYSSNITLE